MRLLLKIAVGLLVPVIVGWLAIPPLWAYWWARHKPNFRQAAVTRGDIISMINSTGTVQPVLNIQVGAFVSGPVGQVLGASTSTVPDTSKLSCSTPLLTKYMRFGKPNDPAQVKLLQTFLNSEMGAGIPISGFFGSQTVSAVKAFQVKYANIILAPWNVTDPTGYVYKTTEWKINEINCADLKAPFPVIN